MNKEPAEESLPPKNSAFPWKTLIIAVSLITLTLTIIVLVYIVYKDAGKVVGSTIQKVETIFKTIPDAAEKFKTGTITRTFTEHIPEVSSTHGDVLEITTSRSEEEFSRSDSKNIAWNLIYLGTTVSTIRVPATFRYHIRLSDSWRLASKDKVCYCLVPSIRPSLPTAIHTGQMQKSTERGWARFNSDANLAELERSITPDLDQRAGDSKHIKLVREACRQSVAEFVKKWLMKEDFWRSDRFTSIVVVFADEQSVNSDEELEQFHYEPTIKLP